MQVTRTVWDPNDSPWFLRVTTTFHLPLSWLQGVEISVNTHMCFCICRSVYIYISMHVHTHICIHTLFYVWCLLGNSQTTAHIFIIIAEVHGLLSYGTPLRIPPVLRTISPCVTDSVPHTEDGVHGKFCYHLSTFCTINVAKTKPEPVLEKLCSSSSSSLVLSLPTLYHPFQSTLLTFSLQASLFMLHGLYSFFSKQNNFLGGCIADVSQMSR